MNPLRTLLAEAIDYAGLFPPASLDMATTIRNYASYRSGEHSWALGRFIVSAARLAEFESTLRNQGRDDGWQISALPGPTLDQDVAAIFKFNKSHTSVIDTIEVKASSVSEIKEFASGTPSTLTTYVEIPLEPNPAPLIAAIAKLGLRVKARTGGITPEAFPPSKTLARFIYECVTAHAPFKVTAGLHHALRATYRLTYDIHSPVGMMYGFLNVFAATIVAYNGGREGDIIATLEEGSPSELHLHDGEIRWRHHRVDSAAIALLKGDLGVSFGSCSFVEPIDDLKNLKLL